MIYSDKKIMSLVYAKNSDEIRVCFMCASRVSTCMRGELVPYRESLCRGTSKWSGPALYESLLTYVAYLDLVGDPLQDTCHAYVPKIHY